MTKAQRDESRIEAFGTEASIAHITAHYKGDISLPGRDGTAARLMVECMGPFIRGMTAELDRRRCGEGITEAEFGLMMEGFEVLFCGMVTTLVTAVFPCGSEPAGPVCSNCAETRHHAVKNITQTMNAYIEAITDPSVNHALQYAAIGESAKGRMI